MTSGGRVTLWYLEWRWNSEKLPNSISSNKRLFKISAKGGAGGNALIGRMAPNRGGRLLISFPEPEGFSNNKAKLWNWIKYSASMKSNWNRQKKERYITHRLSPSINRPCERDKLINICRWSIDFHRPKNYNTANSRYSAFTNFETSPHIFWELKMKMKRKHAFCFLSITCVQVPN